MTGKLIRNANSKELRALGLLVRAGKAKMPKGKPVGVRGLRVKGKCLSETVLENRR